MRALPVPLWIPALPQLAAALTHLPVRQFPRSTARAGTIFIAAPMEVYPIPPTGEGFERRLLGYYDVLR